MLHLLKDTTYMAPLLLLLELGNHDPAKCEDPAKYSSGSHVLCLALSFFHLTWYCVLTPPFVLWPCALRCDLLRLVHVLASSPAEGARWCALSAGALRHQRRCVVDWDLLFGWH